MRDQDEGQEMRIVHKQQNGSSHFHLSMASVEHGVSKHILLDWDRLARICIYGQEAPAEPHRPEHASSQSMEAGPRAGREQQHYKVVG